MPDKRKKFDPGKMAAGAPLFPKSTSKNDPPLSVSLASQLIDTALKQGLPARLRIRGELSNLNIRTHWYFRLKDSDAALDCVMFASAAAKMPTRPESGHEVIASGRIEHYPKQGRTQFYVTSMKPVGEGALELKLRALCDELRTKGCFDDTRKRPIPTFPRKIAIITSKTGAALQDVRDTARRRCAAVDLLAIDIRVQGESAAPQIVRAIRAINTRRRTLGVDAIVLTRGGGSLEDLWAFNEREVAQAILDSALPVVAAIGHETDVTVAELVADARAATPTQAAMRTTPDREALLELLDRSDAHLRGAAARRLDLARIHIQTLHRRAMLASPAQLAVRARERVQQISRRLAGVQRARLHAHERRLHALESRLGRARPEAVWALRRGRLESAERRLLRAGTLCIHQKTDRIASLERTLRVAGPMSVMGRGYSIAVRDNGEIVRSAQDVAPGDRIETRLPDGAVRSIVEGQGKGKEPTSPRRAHKKDKKAHSGDQSGPTLFAQE